MDKNSEMSYEEMKIRKLYNDIYDFEDGGIMSPTGDKVYYIGIIDILTEYNFFKKIKILKYITKSLLRPFLPKQGKVQKQIDENNIEVKKEMFLI